MSNQSIKYCFIILLTVFYGCSEGKSSTSSEDTSKNEKNNHSGLLPELLSDFLRELSIKEEIFEIDPTKHNSFTSDKGCVINIPPNAFTGDTNNSVQISFKSFLEPYDMVIEGLTTVSNGRWLMSDGMFQIAAHQNGTELKLNTDKPIIVSLPTAQNSASLLFHGEVKNGQMNWNLVSDQKPLDYIIPFPVEHIGNSLINDFSLLEYRENVMYNIANPILKNESEFSKYNWWTYTDLKDYQNTVIVTKEFEKMFNQTEGITVHKEVIDFYLKNTDNPLWVIDSLYWNDRFDGIGEHYKVRKHGRVIPLDFDNLNLAEDGYNQLLSLGLNEEEILNTLHYYQLRELILDSLNNEQRLQAFTTVMVGELGWTNIDRFYSEAENAMMLDVTVENSTKNTVVFLIIPEDKVIIRAKKEGNQYFFGEDAKSKIELPMNKKVKIMALDTDSSNALFGTSAIDKWESKLSIKLHLSSVSKDDLSKKLKRFLQE